MTAKPKFRYMPEWDHDGAPDGKPGVDHFVVDEDGNQIACPPDAETAACWPPHPACCRRASRRGPCWRR